MYSETMKYFATEFIEDHLVEPLLHGDEKHREWLKEELRKWIPDLAEQFEGWHEEGIETARSRI